MIEYLRTRFTSTDLVRLASSLLLALLLWGWVTTREDPETTRAFPGVSIEVPELPEGLVVVSAPPDALVRLTGPRSVVNDITTDEVGAHLDLDEIDEPGSYNVDVIVSSPSGVWTRRSTPSQVQIEVDRSEVRQLTIEPVVEGDVGANRRLGRILPESSEVTVRGPSTIVARVARVVLPITIGSQTRDFVGAFSPVAQDQDGQPITEVSIIPALITTTVEIEAAGKSVAVFTQLIGSPAQGLDVLERAVNPATVLIDGPDALLDQIVFVQTLPVDITGATSSVSRAVGLEGLPDGVRVIEPASGQVEVSVQIGERGVRQVLPDLEVNVINLPSGMTAEVSPVDVAVVVLASAENLTRLAADDIKIQIDASALGPGQHTVRPVVSVPPSVQWISTDPEMVTVTIRSIAPAAPATPPGSPVPSPSAG